MIKSILAFVLQISFIAVLSGQTLYYTVKFPDDYTVYGCGADPGIVYPYITQYGDCNFNVGVSYKDQVFYTNSTQGCYKILRTWKLIYWCDYDPNWPSPYFIMNPANTDVGPTVNGNSVNHGYLQYTQIIKVIDTEAPVFINCPTDPVVFCDLTNNDPSQYVNGPIDNCEGPVDLKVKVKDACSGTDIDLTYRLFLDLDGNGSMETYISSSSPSAWPIETTVQGDTVCGQIKFPPGFGLPYGVHKIEWIANDNCGNETLCKYEFIVKDCKPPTLVCYNGLSVNIMPSGMISIWDIDFIQYAYDNCTPTNQLKYGIRKANTGTGFPDNSHGVTFDCSELGEQFVEVWAQDAFGNASYCLTFIDVQDNSGACPPSSPLKGIVATDQSVAVPGVQLTLTKWAQTIALLQTNDEGEFEIGSVPTSCNYKLTPSLDAPHKTGVNTLDALLVAGQLDNILPLPSPYALLAADVDKSGNLTSTDVTNIVNIALGTQTDFPNNTAWQFIPANYVFPNPLNPWAANIPPSLTFCLSGNNNFNPDFVAVKTGDVNGSLNPDNLVANSIEDRQELAVFQTSQKHFVSGQEIRVDIITPDLATLAAFQFTLDFDPNTLSLVGVESDFLPTQQIGQPEANRVTAGWYSSVMLDPNVQGKNIRACAFTLVFNTLRKGILSEALQMTSNVAGAEVYTRQLQTIGASLQFSTELAVAKPDQLMLMPVRPNPVTDHFTAAFYLPGSGETTLTLTDATGQVLQTVQTWRERGYHETVLELGSSARSGLLFLRMDGPGGTETQKVMKF
jgi:hypothetical protein